MKFEKFISLSLCNASIFLIFASIITSCQKKEFDKMGHFSGIEHNTRIPASAAPDLISKFESYQDPKQIYVYCSLSSPEKAKCYYQHLNKVVGNYAKKYNLNPEQVQALKEGLNYQKTETQVSKVNEVILDKIDPLMYKIVLRRSEFCRENATIKYQRCLKQFHLKDTLGLLNQYQSHNGKLNAHEYLYVQNSIEKEINVRLDQEYDKLNNPEKYKQNSNSTYDHTGVQKDTSHL